jgi:hypothetical protein
MQRSLLAILFFTSACARSGPTAQPCVPAGAESSAAAPAASVAKPTSVRPANPADVGSIDGIIAALYGSVSGPPGQARDWDRVRSIFAPGAFAGPVEHLAGGGVAARIVSIDAFIERSSRNVPREGFYETEIARRTDAFGSIVHVFSTLEHRHHPDDARPFRRGINSIQLLKDRDRYWVVSVYWDSEGQDNPIPAQYLPAR